ncbi:MAG: hypothetical protein HUJ42_03395 [Malacoplasma sp.]|nr:hypothetical protein [Malacoplasma sp.]
MAAKNKKKSNSRSNRKEKKTTSKDSKETKKSKFALSDEDIEVIKNKTNDLIAKLQKRASNIFLFKKRKLINTQIQDLQASLQNQEFYLLDTKLKEFEALEKQEKQDLENEMQQSKIKEKKERKIKSFADFVAALKNFEYWPLVSRSKRICEKYDGRDKIWRLALMFSAFACLLIISIIGILFLANVGPFVWTLEGNDTAKIGPTLMLVVPIVLACFI